MTNAPILSFLLLLFVGTICNSMAVSFMGYYIVESLELQPWRISVYTGVFAAVVIASNRAFAKRMDQGAKPFPMIGLAAGAYLLGALAVSVFPGFTAIATAGVVGFGIGSSVMSTMFSTGGIIADGAGVKRTTFNAYMRATTSTSWMVGPALSFTIADRYGADAVFQCAFAIALLWLLLWWFTAPREVRSEPVETAQTEIQKAAANPELWPAILFVFCLALAHSLTFSALPIFFVQEVGLPGYAPGAAFSLKTFVELFAIFSTPFLIARFGLRISLMGTAQVAIVAILVLATVQSFPHMLFGAALEGLYFGLFSTLAISYVQSLSEDRPAHATAMYWNTMMITLVVAGPAAGLIAQLADFQTVILVGSVFAVAALIIIGRVTYQRRHKAS